MKNVKIWVIALMVLMMFGTVASMVTVSTSSVGRSSKVVNTLDKARSDTEVITSRFVIDQNTTDPLTGEKGRYGFDSNVIVAYTGQLIVKNATIYFLADVAHPRSLKVYGSLILYNSTITVSKTQIMPDYHLNVTIDGIEAPNKEVSIVKSRILYEGWFTVVNKTNNILIRDTVFDKIPDITNYGPTPLFKNSTLYMENCSFRNLFQTESGGPQEIGYIENNTSLQINQTNGATLRHFSVHEYPQYSEYWDTVPVKELYINLTYTSSKEYLNKTTDNGSYIKMFYKDMSIPLASARINKTSATNFTSVNMKFNDSFSSADLSAKAIVDNISSGNIRIVITPVDGGGYLNISSVKISFSIERNVITYGLRKFDFNLVNTTIYAKDLYVGANFSADYASKHNRISLYDHSKLYVLNLTVYNSPSLEDSCIYTADASSQVYIFRYAKVHVTFKHIPIHNMKVIASPYLIDSYLKEKVINETKEFINNMQYGNISGSNIWGLTDSEGYAYLPLMSDIVNSSEWPNSRYVGVYNMWIENASGVNYYQAQIGVDHFPNLQAVNNTLDYNAMLETYKHIDVGVQIGIDTPAPYITGHSVRLTLTITNYGTETATDVSVNIFVNSNPVFPSNFTSIIPALPGGDSKSEQVTISGSEFSVDGAYNITVVVNQTWDDNPANDIASVSLHTGKLYVSTWPTQKLIYGHKVNLTLSIYSSRDIPSTSVRIYVDTNPSTPIMSFTSLRAGETPLVVPWTVNCQPGYRELIVYVNSTIIGSDSIYVYKDVDISVDSINIVPKGDIFANQNINIYVNVTNHGSQNASSATTLNITVLDAYGDIVTNDTISLNGMLGKREFSIPFTPGEAGDYSVSAIVESTEDYNSSNNYLSKDFSVLQSPYSVGPLEQYSFVNGSTIKIGISVSSDIVTSLNVVMNIPALNLNLTPSTISNPVNISKGGKVVVGFSMSPDKYQKLLENQANVKVRYAIWLTPITPSGMGEYKFDDNFYFILKEKANYQVMPGSLVLLENTTILNNQKIAEGMRLQVKFMARNAGGISGNVTYIITDNGKEISSGLITNLGPSSTTNISYNFTIEGVELHYINVTLNPKHNATEKMYSDNFASSQITVIPPAMAITYTIESSEHKDTIYEGDHIVVIVHVINENATNAQGIPVYVSGVHVVVNFGGLGSHSATTNSIGVARIEFIATKTGKFIPTITAQYHDEKQSVESKRFYEVVQPPLMERLPWMWIILGIIGLGIGLFFLYGYLSFKKEASEYMICGNCGHLIPADSERCPYCGAVFEKDKVQCPDCGSWIDADSKFCPVCGSVFLKPEEKGYDKYNTLRSKYNQYLSKYKEEARKYIGENYTTEEFFKWWKTHPEYISFEEWIHRQEEEIEGDTVKCPVCGALNPKGAKVCRVCGSPLPASKEETGHQEPERTVEHTVETGKEENSIMKKYKEEYDKLQHPGVVSFEEWVRRREEEKKRQGTPAKETKQEAPAPKKAVVKTGDETPVEEKVKEGYIKCPVCGALNKPGAKTCAVCGAPLDNVKQKEKEVNKSTSHAPAAHPVVKKKVIKKVINVDKDQK